MPPTIAEMISSMETSFMFFVITLRPSRMTVIRSAISSISSSLWDMYTIVIPCSLRFRMIRKRFCTSAGVRDDVGSSKNRIFALRETDFAISTSCCCETLRSRTMSWLSKSAATWRRTSSASACTFFQSTSPSAVFGRRPI